MEHTCSSGGEGALDGQTADAEMHGKVEVDEGVLARRLDAWGKLVDGLNERTAKGGLDVRGVGIPARDRRKCVLRVRTRVRR